MVKKLSLASKIFLLVVGVVLFVRGCFLTRVEPGTIGVRYSSVTGLAREDLKPGYHLEILGLQEVWALPSRYLFLNYRGERVLNIRTKDNNTVSVDVSVVYRIRPGEAHQLVDAGNHVKDSKGRYRFERLADDTAVSVLRETLAQLQTHDFYDTDRRLEVANLALKRLNENLRRLHLEADRVLIRAAYFRPEYERQLAQIQLNEQRKLLDKAKEKVAIEQQKLDKYVQETKALAERRKQDWQRRIAELRRAYQVGFLNTGGEGSLAEARKALEAMPKEQREQLVAKAAKILGMDPGQVSTAHLLGIKVIQAETREYAAGVRALAEGISEKMKAEAEAKIAKVKGEYETKLNRLLATPAGRAYVAYQAAGNVTFDKVLRFNSAEGIPSVLRLRDFAKKFMGL